MWLYLGFGLFLTAFFPYFLHLNPSSKISTSDLVLNPILPLLLSLFSPPPPSHHLMNKITEANYSKQQGTPTNNN